MPMIRPLPLAVLAAFLALSLAGAPALCQQDAEEPTAGQTQGEADSGSIDLPSTAASEPGEDADTDFIEPLETGDTSFSEPGEDEDPTTVPTEP